MHFIKLEELFLLVASLAHNHHTHASGSKGISNENIFSDYENCINQKVRLLNQNLGKPTPRAMLAQMGDDVRMTCDTWQVHFYS